MQRQQWHVIHSVTKREDYILSQLFFSRIKFQFDQQVTNGFRTAYRYQKAKNLIIRKSPRCMNSKLHFLVGCHGNKVQSSLILLAIDKMYRKFRISQNNDELYQLHKKGLLRNPKILIIIIIIIIAFNFSYFVHKYL